MNKILLVEDEEGIRKFTKINIEREGFKVLEADTGEMGIETAKKEKPDVVVLDLMLPGIDGYEVCKTLRKEFPNIGIVMLTAKTQDMDKIYGLEVGADDYLTKPFNPKELILRIKSIIRRIYPENKGEIEDLIVQGPFKLDLYSRVFYKNDVLIELTPTELALITHFMRNEGKAFSRNELLDTVWGGDYEGDTKIVDVNIRRIRSKIEEDSGKPKYIATVWGIGYRWKV